ncbi:MAG: hypothetical protein OEW78_08155 [Nitrosopumilus sp.]|uniref:hypothetical protein n=1 Tax=Nitrosopumilus sp. TaxID=2024843 RepID=UPI00246F7515|nr:hypothetical protein [Nitrosopumilus sp.]MDH5431834.1 hypothetical protein [Nitrosopumilus sp.]
MRKLFHLLAKHAFWAYYRMIGYRGISIVQLDGRPRKPIIIQEIGNHSIKRRIRYNKEAQI